MTLTPELLVAATGCTPAVAAVRARWLDYGAGQYGIDTPRRMAHFVAQCAHESALFTVLRESLMYRADRLAIVWPSRFYLPPDPANGRLDARIYAMAPQALANVVYADRMGNGPVASGDGYRYCGKGLIQLTGKANYVAFFKAQPKYPAITYPDVLTTDEASAVAAAWFFGTHGCNEAADANLVSAVTMKVNGGLNGLKERTALTARALAALGEPLPQGNP